MPAQTPDAKALALISGYMMGLEEIDETVKEDMNKILRIAPHMVDMMLMMAMTLAMQNKEGKQPKRILARNIMTIIDFSQCLAQGLWKDDNVMYQLPGMTDDRIDIVKAIKKKPTI